VARRREKLVIERPGRDLGKVFWITEMSAAAAEYWAGRLLTMLAKGNQNVPSGFFQMGVEGIAAWVAVHGVGGIDWIVAKPLLDEMMDCVTIQPDPNRALTRPLIEDDIEEITTRLAIREAWFDTHLGFSVRARYFNWTTEPLEETNQSGPNIATFPAQQLGR
jgi:hypothetical protein